ncbi:glycosyltransferase family 4 protein [Haloarcula amylovorans]|uniref:glycosyltransferase family 4 protein n=1 Tax=Haloarcula amylovorans TaxID=2562280 RepID=UPI00107624FB|nr:glycosyltransferase family 4 protein [Halomicroarcula amylolytica]
MKPVSFVAYGDIGSQPGRDITELSRGLYRRDLLEQVYCRGIETHDLPKHLVTTPIPLGRAIPRAMTGINRYVTERFDKRYYAEQLFDTFAARAVEETEIQLHHTPGYLRTLRAGNSAGSRTVVKATTEYSKSFDQRMAQTYRDLGVAKTPPKMTGERSERRERTLRECDQILAISAFVKRSLLAAGFPAEKVSVTPLGVDATDYQESQERDDAPFTALYVGSVTVEKGVPYLLAAWKRNQWGKDTDARLLLCGDISSTMQELISQYGFENVETPGFVDPRKYHRDASVFVFPTLSDGFGKAPLEGMAAGLPVISTERTGMPDIMSDGREGFIVPAGDATALADRLKELREQSAVRRKMGKRALETARKQTWDKHAEAVVDALGLSG